MPRLRENYEQPSKKKGEKTKRKKREERTVSEKKRTASDDLTLIRSIALLLVPLYCLSALAIISFNPRPPFTTSNRLRLYQVWNTGTSWMFWPRATSWSDRHKTKQQRKNGEESKARGRKTVNNWTGKRILKGKRNRTRQKQSKSQSPQLHRKRHERRCIDWILWQDLGKRAKHYRTAHCIETQAKRQSKEPEVVKTVKQLRNRENKTRSETKEETNFGA